MSAVERDSQIEMLGAEAPASEKGLTRKIASSNGRGGTSPNINRLPGVRDITPSQLPDVRRYLNECSLELQGFISPLEASIRKAHRFRLGKYKSVISAQAKVAELVLDTIRRIAHRETGVFNLEAPVAHLLSSLCAGSVEVGIVSGLVRRAQRALSARDTLQREQGRLGAENSVSARGLGYDVGRELDELTMLLTWYVRRKMSLASLEVDSVVGFSAIGIVGNAAHEESDALFALEVMHDHKVFGCKGCSISCGLRLVGRDGQPLWLRVSVLSNGSPVAARPEWSSWTDPGGEQVIEVLAGATPFCSLVPIRANAQRLVIDEIRAFVPYSALDLPAGRREVELIVSVVDNDGNEVVSATSVENISIPPKELSLTAVPAPHSVGMWPHDVVSGDKISEFSLSSGYSTLAGWEYHAISAQFDLSLFMHAGESVMLECRFLDAEGKLVELSSLGIPFVASEMNVAVESVSSYRYRRVLRPKGAWALYQGLRIDIPVEFLLLEPGVHDITCELLIVSSDDRILCGDMSRTQVHVPARESRDTRGDGEDVSSPERSRGGEVSGPLVRLESLEIDSSWVFGQEESIRVEASFVPCNTSNQLAELAAGRLGELFAPYRVELSLEREDGHVLLQAFTDRMGMSFKPVTRTVCVDGQAGMLEHRVVTNFSKHEVLGWSLGNESTRANAKVRLFARVTALTLNGEIITSTHKEFFVRPPTAQDRVVTKTRYIGPTVVDVVASSASQGGRLMVNATINMPAGEFADEGVAVTAFLCARDGTKRQLSSKQISAHHDGLWTRPVTGLTQMRVGWDSSASEAQLEASGATVEVVITSVADEPLSRVEQPVKSLGVLSEVEASAAQAVDSDDLMSAAQQPEKLKERGFFSRFLKS